MCMSKQSSPQAQAGSLRQKRVRKRCYSDKTSPRQSSTGIDTPKPLSLAIMIAIACIAGVGSEQDQSNLKLKPPQTLSSSLHGFIRGFLHQTTTASHPNKSLLSNDQVEHTQEMVSSYCLVYSMTTRLRVWYKLEMM